jgi:hypothetical protein
MNYILSPVSNLDDLVSPFSKDEIDKIIANLPSGKSPHYRK